MDKWWGTAVWLESKFKNYLTKDVWKEGEENFFEQRFSVENSICYISLPNRNVEKWVLYNFIVER